MRRFVCPFCSFVHTFSPKEAQKYPKKPVGFTCPRCHKKPTKADLAKTKGQGPKPKGERRKRVKKAVVKDTTPAIVQPYVEPLEWRSGPAPPGERQRYAVRPEWQPKPTTRTIEEVIVEEHLSKMTREASESATKTK